MLNFKWPVNMCTITNFLKCSKRLQSVYRQLIVNSLLFLCNLKKIRLWDIQQTYCNQSINSCKIYYSFLKLYVLKWNLRWIVVFVLFNSESVFSKFWLNAFLEILNFRTFWVKKINSLMKIHNFLIPFYLF